MMRTTRKTFEELGRAINELKNFHPVQWQSPLSDDEREISMAIEAALEPFYAKREKAIYEAAKKFVAEYEDGES